MPTADPSNVLFKVAHPDLYERNPFNILNLPVDATAKDIRRRKEDIEAAFDAGTEAELFRDMLPGDDRRKIPSRSEISNLFELLTDPETRIAFALFWFWPESLSDRRVDSSSQMATNSNRHFGHQTVVSNWGREAKLPPGSTPTQSIAKHNFAVYHHMMGLAYEIELSRYGKNVVETPVDVPFHWDAAIREWNGLADDMDFWHLVSILALKLNDPRIDNRFIWSLRDQFPFAFDQINTELAINYAKLGREDDSRRQIAYMKLSQPDTDDVEGSLDDAFGGLQRQVDAIVSSAKSETKKAPSEGLNLANILLENIDEPLRISRIVLNRGSRIRKSIVTTIFEGVRFCLTLYGQATKDWKTGLSATRQLKELAETPEQLFELDKDIEVYKTLVEKEESKSACIACGAQVKETVAYVPMHANVTVARDGDSVLFDKKKILVPLCAKCAKARCLPIPTSFDHYPLLVVHPEVEKSIKSGWRLGARVSQQAAESEIAAYRNQVLFGKREVFSSKESAVAIRGFHLWCAAYEQFFPYVNVRKKGKEKVYTSMLDILLSVWDVSWNDKTQIYGILRLIRTEDLFTLLGVSPDMPGKDNGYFGTNQRAPDPMAPTYQFGYEIASTAFYLDDLSFDVARAHDELVERLYPDIRQYAVLCSSEERLRKLPRYGGLRHTFSLRVHATHKQMLGLSKIHGVFVFEIDLNPMNRFESTNLAKSCVSWTLYQNCSSGLSFKSPRQILDKVLSAFAYQYDAVCFSGRFLSEFGNTDNILDNLCVLLTSLTNLLVQELFNNDYEVDPSAPMPNVSEQGWQKITQF